MRADLEDLRAFGNAPVLFISDPTNGDQFVVGSREELERFEVPSSAEGHELSTAEELISRLDFSAYDGGFELTLA
jgi:hypothetical protein